MTSTNWRCGIFVDLLVFVGGRRKVRLRELRVKGWSRSLLVYYGKVDRS